MRNRGLTTSPELMKAYKRRWYLANKERWSSYKKAQDPVKLNVQTQQWRRNHRERFLKADAAARKRRRQWSDDLKSAPCMDCATVYPPYVMEWDHVRGTKRDHVSKLSMQKPKHIVLAEIAKCELVCANCHRIRTFNAETRAKVSEQIRSAQGKYYRSEGVA